MSPTVGLVLLAAMTASGACLYLSMRVAFDGEAGMGAWELVGRILLFLWLYFAFVSSIAVTVEVAHTLEAL